MNVLRARRTLTVILSIGLIFGASSARAENLSAMTCTGPGCDFLPFTPADFTRILAEFQNQYSNKLFDDMAAAAVVANLTSPPIGTVNLYGFTFGGNLGAGYKEISYSNVQIAGLGTFEKVPSAGVAVNPRFFVGVNLGALLGMEYDPMHPETRSVLGSLLGRFDIYASGFEKTEKYNPGSSAKGDVSASVYSRGMEVRYHLVEGNDIVGGPLLHFLGVSIGAGYYQSRMDALYSQDQSIVTFSPTTGTTVSWDGNNRMSWQSSIWTMPLEIKTGLQLLYFFNIYLGGGVAISKGYMDFSMSRTGRVYFTSEQAALAGFTIPDASLAIMLNGSGAVPSRMPYGKVGVEVNLLWLKVTVEGIIARGTYGVNVGTRIEF